MGILFTSEKSFASFEHTYINACLKKHPATSQRIYVNSNQHLSSLFEMAVISYIIRNGYKYCNTVSHFENPYTIAKNLESKQTDIFIGAFMHSINNNIGWYNLKDKYNLDISTNLVLSISSRWVFPKYLLINHPEISTISSWRDLLTYYNILEQPTIYSRAKKTVIAITMPKDTLFYNDGVEVIQKLYIYPQMTTIRPRTWDEYNKIVTDLYQRKKPFLLQNSSIESFDRNFSFQTIDAKNDVKTSYKQVILSAKNKLPPKIYNFLERVNLSDKLLNKYINLLHVGNMRLVLLYFLKQEPNIWKQWVIDKDAQQSIINQMESDSSILFEQYNDSSIDRIIFHHKNNQKNNHKNTNK